MGEWRSGCHDAADQLAGTYAQPPGFVPAVCGGMRGLLRVHASPGQRHRLDHVRGRCNAVHHPCHRIIGFRISRAGRTAHDGPVAHRRMGRDRRADDPFDVATEFWVDERRVHPVLASLRDHTTRRSHEREPGRAASRGGRPTGRLRISDAMSPSGLAPSPSRRFSARIPPPFVHFLV